MLCCALASPFLDVTSRRLAYANLRFTRWHYIITGPENTPYHGGQYWGTLIFPPNYPFAPPAIQMHTPSGRFQPSTRLCLSISDFHPRSFNPAWEVCTILIGLLSFMTSEDVTTGSLNAPEAERRFHAARSRWWNSTGNGTHARSLEAAAAGEGGGSATGTKDGGKAAKLKTAAKRGNVKVGDGGAKFVEEWPDVDRENWTWMRTHRIDFATGQQMAAPGTAGGGRGSAACVPQLKLEAAGSAVQGQAVRAAVRQQRDAGQGWLYRNKVVLILAGIFVYVLIARLLGQA